jgi:hypothetical protein
MRRCSIVLVTSALVLGACAPSDDEIAVACQREASRDSIFAVSKCIQSRKHDRDKPAWSETAKLFGR